MRRRTSLSEHAKRAETAAAEFVASCEKARSDNAETRRSTPPLPASLLPALPRGPNRKLLQLRAMKKRRAQQPRAAPEDTPCRFQQPWPDDEVEPGADPEAEPDPSRPRHGQRASNPSPAAAVVLSGCPSAGLTGAPASDAAGHDTAAGAASDAGECAASSAQTPRAGARAAPTAGAAGACTARVIADVISVAKADGGSCAADGSDDL